MSNKELDYRLCPNCRNVFYGNNLYCSKKCKTEYAWKDVEVKQCKYCGSDLEFRMFGTRQDYEKALFCDKKCRVGYLKYLSKIQFQKKGWYKIGDMDINIIQESNLWYWKSYRNDVFLSESDTPFYSLESAINNVVEVFK